VARDKCVPEDDFLARNEKAGKFRKRAFIIGPITVRGRVLQHQNIRPS
jgi:hypothetical protein